MANFVSADHRPAIIGRLFGGPLHLDDEESIHEMSSFRRVTCVTFVFPKTGLN